MKYIYCLLSLVLTITGQTQPVLKPGFDAKEYGDLLSLTFHSSSIADSALRSKTTDPYQLIYRSPELGLLNRWTLYQRTDNTGVIDLRGTVNQGASWLENFYAAMIPATGSLTLDDSTVFNYQFATDPKAQVHVGWTVGIAYLGPSILKQVNEVYHQKKINQFLLFGHSQGGALAFLLRSWLEYEKKQQHLPSDIVFKTYCSAAPKPGNLYYAYDYDFITRGGWGHTVVNAADWVPETPFSVQTLHDFNTANPLTGAKASIKKQKLLARVALNHVYNKLDRSTRKAQRRQEKYLGKMLYKQVKKTLPGLQQPGYAGSSNYMRAGTPVVLMPDSAYFAKFPDQQSTPFIHHLYAPYAYLLNHLYFTSK